MPHQARRIALIATASLAGACTFGTPALSSPEVPAALQAPPGEVRVQALRAAGVQIYECVAAPDRPGGSTWAFRGPEAELTDAQGRPAGRHYAGPTWEAPDGSAVTGRVIARHDAPDGHAVPWLLLAASPTGRAGAFSAVRSIQRVETAGGLAPTAPCEPGREGLRIARVPYRAVYHFYAAAR